MITGTSTGGIIALALGAGMTARQAAEIYTERGSLIFPKGNRIFDLPHWLRRPKHDQSVLKDELLKVFGDRLLDDATTRLVIPSFEGRYGEPYIYKTPHHPDYKRTDTRRPRTSRSIRRLLRATIRGWRMTAIL